MLVPGERRRLMSRTLRTSAAALWLIAVFTVGCGDDSPRQTGESVPPGSVDATSTSAATSTSTTAPGPVTITPTVDNDVPQRTIVIPLASLNEGRAAAQHNGCDCVEDHSGTGGIVALADGRIALLLEGDTTVHVVDPSGGLSTLLELPEVALDAPWLTISGSDRVIVHPAGGGAEVTIDLGQHEWMDVLSSATLDDGRLVILVATPVNGHNTFSLLIVDGDEATLVPFDFDPTIWNVAFTMAVPMAVHGSSVTVAGYGGGVTLTTFDL